MSKSVELEKKQKAGPFIIHKVGKLCLPVIPVIYMNFSCSIVDGDLIKGFENRD